MNIHETAAPEYRVRDGSPQQQQIRLVGKLVTLTRTADPPVEQFSPAFQVRLSTVNQRITDLFAQEASRTAPDGNSDDQPPATAATLFSGSQGRIVSFMDYSLAREASMQPCVRDGDTLVIRTPETDDERLGSRIHWGTIPIGKPPVILV